MERTELRLVLGSQKICNFLKADRNHRKLQKISVIFILIINLVLEHTKGNEGTGKYFSSPTVIKSRRRDILSPEGC